MRDPVREAEDRKLYVNLPADVSINYCTAAEPMPIEIANRVATMKQLWIHDDAEETEESKEIDGSTMWLRCPHCGHAYSCYIGD